MSTLINVRRPVGKVLVLLGCLSLGEPSWAIHKCTGPGGKVSFQDTPCNASDTSERLNAATHSGSPPPPVVKAAPSPSATAATAPPPVAPPREPPINRPVKSQREIEADMCLNWYRPLLRDPAGAYYSDVSKEQRVLTLKLHATNGFGGYVVREAACEIYNGRLNESWTRIHAERGGWVSR